MQCDDIDSGPIFNPVTCAVTLTRLSLLVGASYLWWIAANWIVGKAFGYC